MLLRKRCAVKDVDDLMGSPWKRWGLGGLAALLLIAYGVRCLVAGRAYLPGRHNGMDVTGALAIAMGMAYTGLGAFLHFRFFWRDHPALWRFAEAGMIASILAVVGALGYVLIKITVFW